MGSILPSCYLKGSKQRCTIWLLQKLDSWNVGIKGLRRLGELTKELSFRLPPSLHCSSGKADEKTLDRSCSQKDIARCASFLRWCGDKKALFEGKRIHELIVKDKLEGNVYIGSLLIRLYCECGALEEAQKFFESLSERNVFSWNFIIRANARLGQTREALQLFERMHQELVIPDRATFVGLLSACTSRTDLLRAHVQNGHCQKALELFSQMQQNSCTPNRVTFISVLDASASLASLLEVDGIHALIVRYGLDSDIVVGNALINMYGKCGNLEHARSAFDTILDRNIITWTAMIAGYAEHGQCAEVLQLFRQMQTEGTMPNKVSFVTILSGLDQRDCERIHACIVLTDFGLDLFVANSLISVYGKCGSWKHACKIFDRMLERDTISWNAIIGAFAQNAQGKDALQLFGKMQQESSMPDRVTYVSILDACANHTAIVEGKRLYARIMSTKFESDVVVSTALLNLYGKCGSLEDAVQMFENMPQFNVVSWNAMMAACAQHGHGRAALVLLDKMKQEGVTPNRVTFVCILSACSHSGLVDEACHCFTSMTEHGISPIVDHYNCIVDLLGRAGRLHEAEDLIYNMPLKATTASLMALLGACRRLVDVERGERCAMHGVELNPDSAAPYVMLYNIHALAATSKL